VEHFSSGWKRNYYGKGDVIVYRLNRDGRVPEGQSPVFGANVLMLTYGDAFWPTYTIGDNTGLVATDSMKNFIQRETMNFAGDDLPQSAQIGGYRGGRQSRIVAGWRADRRIWAGTRELDVQR